MLPVCSCTDGKSALHFGSVPFKLKGKKEKIEFITFKKSRV